MPFMISSSASSPASLWARSITTLIIPPGTRAVQMFIRPGFFVLGSKDRRPSDTCSTENPSARVAEVTASTFSTLTPLRPAKVIGTSTTCTTGRGSAPGRRTQIHPSRSVVIRPPSDRTLRPEGESGSRVNTQIWALVPSRIANVRGSSALSTHQPSGLVIFVMTALTSASWSRVSIPSIPRWSALMLVTIETSLYATPTPRRKIPPRAVSVTANSTPGWRSTRPAPPGPEKSPASISSPSMYTPSVLDQPTDNPARRATCPIIRAVVVLPLVPVIATTGISGRISRGAEPSGAAASAAPSVLIISATEAGPGATLSSTRASPYANASARPELRHG